ncbi:flagellar motor protein MotB [Sphingomonas sp. 37zxx]|uniref:flagellar motor protein MotB n=1 Tax=Sphingomonas sp. 37zxx TaxID=1550073 RepID=UPI00053BF790|nr:flagellar motor protein MotB [Sphingomonas sp. 37zxx]
MALAPKAKEPTIVIRKVKKGGHAAHHGGAWKVAYADFVTAMMAFFMLLWLLANPDKAQLKGLAEYFSPESPNSVSSAPMSSAAGSRPVAGGQPRKAPADTNRARQPASTPQTQSGKGRGATATAPDASMRIMAAELRVALETQPDNQSSMRVETDREGVRITLMDTKGRSMFVAGTATLNPFARVMLSTVARKMAPSGAQIAIEGHTDAIGGQSDANWRLSSERALAARSTMIAAGLTPDRFTEVVALAGTQPVYPGQPDRPENRRITIIAVGEAPTLPSDTSFKF